MSDSMECNAVPYGNYTYRKDFDLGDIVTVKKPDWGVEATSRITEVEEIYEHGAASIDLTLGDPLPQKIDLEGMV